MSTKVASALSLDATDALDRAADDAASLLKLLANPSRLRLLCALAGRPRCVGELERMLGSRQSYVSGQLAILRDEGIVACAREGRQVRYSLADPRVLAILERLEEVYCPVLEPPAKLEIASTSVPGLSV